MATHYKEDETMQKIQTLEELLQKSIAIRGNEMVSNPDTGEEGTINSKHWLEEFFSGSFNTCNGVIVFIDNAKTLRVIPKFFGLIELLKDYGFRQNFMMPVPLADGSRPTNPNRCSRWDNLRDDYRSYMGIA